MKYSEKSRRLDHSNRGLFGMLYAYYCISGCVAPVSVFSDVLLIVLGCNLFFASIQLCLSLCAHLI